MIIRNYCQCMVCQKKLILRTGIGLESKYSHTFDCPSCFTPLTVDAIADTPPIARLEMRENISEIKEDSDINTYVNLHPSVAFRIKEYHSSMTFASMEYMHLIDSFMRVPANERRKDASIHFDVPYTQQVWLLVRSVLTLTIKGDPAGVLNKQIVEYETQRQKYSPEFRCKTSFKCVASFLDDIFYPAIGVLRNPLKKFISTLKQSHSIELNNFETYYQNELQQANLERYLSIFNDYFRYFDQLRQMLVHARIGSNDVDDYVVGSKRFEEIKLYYGQAYETLTSSYVTLACLNNIAQNRKYDVFKEMTLNKYIKDVDKAKKANAFKECAELAAFTNFEDSSLRNGSHHASIQRQGEVIVYRSGGTGAEHNLSYSNYIHKCNGITIALAAMFLVELEMFSSFRPR